MAPKRKSILKRPGSAGPGIKRRPEALRGPLARDSTEFQPQAGMSDQLDPWELRVPSETRFELPGAFTEVVAMINVGTQFTADILDKDGFQAGSITGEIVGVIDKCKSGLFVDLKVRDASIDSVRSWALSSKVRHACRNQQLCMLSKRSRNRL